MTAQLDDLRIQVERANTVMDSSAVLLGALAAEIRALKDDPVALEQLAQRLSDETDELAAAVAANTPAAPEPEPAPEDDGA